jgi:hypothetical protein
VAQKSETGHCDKSVRGVAMFCAARATPDPALILRRANASRQHEDYDVFDGEQDIGRILPGQLLRRPRDLVQGCVVPAHRAQELRAGGFARCGEGGVSGGV